MKKNKIKITCHGGILLISQLGGRIDWFGFFFFLTESKNHREVLVHRLQYQREMAVGSIT